MADNTAGQTRTETKSQGTPGHTIGKVVLDATAIVATEYLQVTTGFKPRYVCWKTAANVTVEWFEGMAANTCFKTASTGARTLEVANGGITVDDTGFRVLQNATLAAVLASSTNYYVAQV